MSEEIITPPKRTTARNGSAPAIRKLHEKYPEMTKAAIARKVGCTPHNVSVVLAKYLHDTSPEGLADFQANKAEVYDALQHRLLSSLTPEKISNSKVMEAVTAAAILEDKARLVRGQATGINVTVLMDVAEAIRARRQSS